METPEMEREYYTAYKAIIKLLNENTSVKTR